MTHVRWAGAVERGTNGKLLLHKLPFSLLTPGARPAVESLQDVRSTRFLEKIVRPCCVHADGAKSWRSECRKFRLPFRNVVHVKMQFSKMVKVKGKRKLTGTQLLDQVWRHLKKYVPKELSTREGLGTRDAARLEQYVRSFQFRWNQKMNLADALAKRAAKHRG